MTMTQYPTYADAAKSNIASAIYWLRLNIKDYDERLATGGYVAHYKRDPDGIMDADINALREMRARLLEARWIGSRWADAAADTVRAADYLIAEYDATAAEYRTTMVASG